MTTATVAWPVFDAPLIDRELVADRTMSFRWRKPSNWTYRAGQFIDITLHNPPETDAEGDTRGFSISSAPCEDVIQITTRLRDTAFKRSLRELPLGTTMKLEGPFGDLRLHHAQRPAVLLAGGIGITPFRSILVEAIRCGSLAYPVALFHSYRRPDDAPFTTEMQALSMLDQRFRFVPTMTALTGDDADWSGEHGRIDGPMLARHIADFVQPIYYIAGPAGMVQGLRAMLEALGVDQDDIRTEEFTGY